MHQKIIFALMKAMVMFSIIFFHKNILPANLNGTVSPTFVYTNTHQVFSNGESARGFVRMNRGFTIKPGAIATLDTVLSVSGSIDLRETGILQLLTDLKLDNNLTWSSGGYINGRQKGIILNGTLSIPASKIIRIIGDTIIDGQGNNLILSENAQIIVESNATLTLRNLTLQNIRQNPFNPCLKVAGNKGKLALDNVNFAITGDLQFAQGQLYIHNDVIFTGTSAFIYASTAPCFVAPSGKMLFDINTTLSFISSSTYAHELFVLQDRTSTIHFNGCSLKTTSSGMRLTRGNLILNNKVSLESQTNVEPSSLTALTSQDYGTAIWCLAWNPSGKVLALGGQTPVNGAGGFANTNEVRLYSFDGTTLTALTSVDFGTLVWDVGWNPAGDVLAIGGNGPTSGNELQLYRFNGSTLTLLTSQDYGVNGNSEVDTVAWHPSGNVLAIGGWIPVNGAGGFANTNEVRLYSFNGTSLTPLTSVDYGNDAEALTWNPDGTVLTVAGTGPVNGAGGFANTNEVRLYSFNGSTLTPITSVDYGSFIYTLEWNPSGTILAISGQTPVNGAGGFANTDEVRLYSFNGTSLTPLTSVDYGSDAECVTWHPSGTMLAIGGSGPVNGAGGFANTNELRLYNFDGTSLTPLTSQDYGSAIWDLAWHPSGRFIALGGQTPVNGAGGFANTNELRLYSTNFISKSSQQSISKSIVFGNSALGSDYDLNVEVLGNAHVIVDGKVMDDSA